LDKSDSWLLATMQPKGDPIEQLALAMARLAKSPSAGDHLRQQGRENPLALHEQVETLLGDDGRQRCILLVDQFEETFTQTKEEDRAAFIGLLTEAAGVENGRLTIILSLRADFVSHCARYPDLRALMSQQFQLVGAMDPPDLAKAITLPSLEVGAEIDPALVSRIMADMKGEPGALPLMSFALRDLFEAEKSAKGKPMDLTLPEYLQRGGIESALERHANKVFDTFTDEQKGLARGVFSKLIEVGQGRADTRRTAVFSELVPSGTEDGAVTAVVDALSEKGVRLITTSGEGGTVTIAHEKLIDAWPWLRQLVDENRDMIVLQNQINDDAKSWNEEKDTGFLYSGGRLVQVEDQLKASNPDLNELSQAFIQVSLDQRQKEIEEKEAIARRELEQAQALAVEQQQRAEEQTAAARRLRGRNILFAGAAVAAMALAIVAFVFFGSAQSSAQDAVDNLSLAKTREFEAITAQADAENNLETANIALEAEAAAKAEASANLVIAQDNETEAIAAKATAEAEQNIAQEQTILAQEQAAVAQSRSLSTSSLAVGHENDIRALLLAIAAEQEASTASSFNALYTSLPFVPSPSQLWSHEWPVNGAMWNQDESIVLTWSDDDWVAKLWDGISGELLHTLSHDSKVVGAVWNQDGSQILTWSGDGLVTLWDGKSGEMLQILSYDGEGVAYFEGAKWNQDESQILIWGILNSDLDQFDQMGMLGVWDKASGELIQTFYQEEYFDWAVWNQDSSQILTWGNAYDGNGAVKLWDRTSGELFQTLPHEGYIQGASWSQDDNQILTWSGDMTAKLWDRASGRLLQTLSHDGAVYGASWSQDGNQILTWSADGTVKLWDKTSGELLQTLSHTSDVYGAIWNQDESQILTWSEDLL